MIHIFNTASKIIISILFALLFTHCQYPIPMNNESIFAQYAKPDRKDHHSFANPSEAITKHLDLDIKLDFEKKILTGIAQYNILNNNATEMIFDTRAMTIDKVVLNDKDETTFSLGANNELLGQPLKVTIKKTTTKVSIYYKTSPDAPALQWLDPQQTADKKHPFLFSQGQAILTRSWIPCQDSPGIRITYDAKVEIPKDLLPVMSAENPFEKNDYGVYTFKMKQAIPPYLIAIAVGDLSFGSIGEQCGIYAEPSVLESAVYEFADTEKMLHAAEKLYGPYLWDRYDIIVLPPSFPFGGMENPRLTFATPTIIAGDRSLTSLVAHELAHSWSGNLVTNATWNDFWLNEGFTVYFERRIMEALYGADYANMLAMLGFQDLEADVEHIGHSHADTHLKLDLKGRDADDGMTDIAYEKGAYFLMSLEAQIGREKFDLFIKDYFSKHRFQTLTTDEFIVYLKEHLIEKYHLETDIEAWIHGPGIPEDCPVVVSDKFSKINNIITNKIKKGQLKIDDASVWTTHEWLHFIRHLPQDLNPETMAELEKIYGFSKSGNAEILAAWFELSIINGHYVKIKSEIKSFLTQVGRRKFLTPLYTALKEEGDMAFAKEIYTDARENYHAVSVQTMDKLLEI